MRVTTFIEKCIAITTILIVFTFTVIGAAAQNSTGLHAIELTFIAIALMLPVLLILLENIAAGIMTFKTNSLN